MNNTSIENSWLTGGSTRKDRVEAINAKGSKGKEKSSPSL